MTKNVTLPDDDDQQQQQQAGNSVDVEDNNVVVQNNHEKMSRPYYRDEVEFRNRDELEAISLDWDKMRIHSLLICERVLGTAHKDMIYRLMFRGASYADSLKFQQCIDLWKYALELRVKKDSILYCDTCFTGQALVRLFFNLHSKYVDERSIDHDVQIEDVLSTVELLVRDMPDSMAKLQVLPVYKRQQESYNRIMNIITHLLHLLTLLMNNNDQQQQPDGDGEGGEGDEGGKTRPPAVELSQQQVLDIKRRVHHIVHRVDPRTTNGDSLLHMSCMRKNTLKGQSVIEESAVNFFPSHNVVKLLVECGAKINAMNTLASTPLHTASLACNFNQEVRRSGS